jgi:hypothetical protein
VSQPGALGTHAATTHGATPAPTSSQPAVGLAAVDAVMDDLMAR